MAEPRKVHPHMPGDVTSWVCGGSGLAPQSQRELDDFREWLLLPKPREAFHLWRQMRAPDSEVRDG